jgi:predicted TIM-barrel fold metal-dependent hydrolase
MIDGHVHIQDITICKDEFRQKRESIGGKGAILLSLAPETFYLNKDKHLPVTRLKNVLEWCNGDEYLYPFFWLDPLADDATEQVCAACKKGIAGFKIICDRFYPSNERAMKIYNLISSKAKPILFHSGVLWDGKASSKYNRPMEFECLLEVPKLKFSLAHVSWPWHDELIAMYGKFLEALNSNNETSSEMFIDTTPGTPLIYRKEVLTKLYTVGYNIENNIFFGTDSRADNYSGSWTKKWIDIDTEIFRELALSEEQITKYFSANVKRFLHA